MWYIHTIEYYSVVQRNEVMTPAATQMNPENNVLRKKPDTKGYTLYDLVYMKCPEYTTQQRQKN